MKVSGWVAAKYRCDNNLLRFARSIMIPVRYGIDKVEPGLYIGIGVSDISNGHSIQYPSDI